MLIVKTNNPLKKKAINIVSNMSDEKNKRIYRYYRNTQC